VSDESPVMLYGRVFDGEEIFSEKIGAEYWLLVMGYGVQDSGFGIRVRGCGL